MFSRNLSDAITNHYASPATISVEIAFTTGLIPLPCHRVDHHRKRFAVHARHHAGDDVIVDRDRECSSAAAITPARITGSVTSRNASPLARAEIECGLLERGIEGSQPGDHDDHDEGDRECHMCRRITVCIPRRTPAYRNSH